MSDKITYNELVDQVAAKMDRSKEFVGSFINSMVVIVNEGLERDQKARLAGFGIFELHHIPETTGTNPRTGKVIPIPGHTRVAFRPADAIEQHVNRSYAHLPTEVMEKPAAAEDDKPDEAAKAEPASEPAQEPAPTRADRPGPPPAPPAAPRKRSRWGDLAAVAAVAVAAIVIASRFYGGRLPEIGDSLLGFTDSLAAKIGDLLAEDTTAIDLEATVADTAAQEIAATFYDSLEVTTVAELELGREPGGVEFAREPDVASVPLTTHTIPASAPTTTRFQTNGARQHKVVPGDHLWNLAQEHYHQPLFWVHIFGANTGLIGNPDSLPYGETIIIPDFDGSPSALTIRDSVNLSMGALQAYEAYKDHNQEWSAYYLRMSRRYQPAAVTAGAR